MKKLGDYIGFVFLLACIFFMISCEKPDGEKEFINTNEPEGFTNTIIDTKIGLEKDQDLNEEQH
ncbi:MULTISPECIES: hypothetical protein [Aquimarina]|uniref:hypothetical protein n=1 Tax=Aquimarina TaxID=290174 RepID=UPI000832B181|nr:MULTISPECIES: hypothetical protein [Aquimarina]